MRIFNYFLKSRNEKLANKQDIKDLVFIRNAFLPLMILGKNGHYHETINKILEEKGDFFVKLLEEFNDDLPNYQCPYSKKQFVIKFKKIKDVYLNELNIIKIKLPKTAQDTLFHCSMVIIAYNEDMTSRQYVTVEKGYGNSYDIYRWTDEFDYIAYDDYSENNLLTLLRGYYDYSNAPKAESRKNLLEFFTDNDSFYSIVEILHIFIVAYLFNLWEYIISPFVVEDFIIPIILSLSMYYFVFKKIKSLLEIYIGEQSIIETYSASLSPEQEFNINNVKADATKIALKLGSILITISVVLITLTIVSTYYRIVDVQKLADNEFNEEKIYNDENKIYRIEEFYVLYKYAQTQDRAKLYYYAVLPDKSENLYFMSFSIMEENASEIIGFSDKNPISAYFKISKLSDNLSNHLSSIFPKTRKYEEEHNKKSFYINMNAEYICSTEENILLNTITNKFTLLLMTVVILFIGIYICLKAMLGNSIKYN